MDERPSAAAPSATGRTGEAPFVLYVHPRGHLNDVVVPAGALSALNALPVTKLGRYAFEVSEDEIRAAAIVALDFHWGISLTGMEQLVGRVRRIRPDVPIVAGGISAGHYAEELTRSGAVQYVLRGDSEEGFAALVAALLAGQEPGTIPNVVGRDGPLAVPKRMSRAAFDATDPLTADWFPTLERLRGWDARAFPAGPTVPVARGCPMRCPACYGSFAETFGPGWLLRSPQSTTSLVARAAELGARNLRLIVCKPGEAAVSALASALAAAGPFRLDAGVGLYLCTPPAPDTVEALLAAFEGRVVLSAVAPQEHTPALSPERLATELDGWWHTARQARGSHGRLRLDVWASTVATRDEIRSALGGDGPSLGVSLSSVWDLTRPVDGARLPLDALREAVAPLWTFYAARLLSPALADVLEPFRLLDELDDPPEDAVSCSGALGAWGDVILAHWRAHRLPLLPGLAFSAAPLGSMSGATLARARGDAHFEGAAWYAPPEKTLPIVSAPVRLVAEEDHSAVRLRSATALPAADAYALVPHMPGARELEPSWLQEIASAGLVVVGAPPRPAGAVALQVALRVQEAWVALLGPGGMPVRRGRAHLDYMRPSQNGRGAASAGALRQPAGASPWQVISPR